MSANNANPILRRLGIKGEATGGHFNGGRSGKSGDEDEFYNSDIVRLLVKIAIKEEKERRELDFAAPEPVDALGAAAGALREGQKVWPDGGPATGSRPTCSIGQRGDPTALARSICHVFTQHA